MDQLADKLEIDQLEFRLKNSLKDGDKTVCGQKLQSVGITDCLKALKENKIEIIGDTPTIGAEGFKVIFIHPRSAGGVLVELAERNDS